MGVLWVVAQQPRRHPSSHLVSRRRRENLKSLKSQINQDGDDCGPSTQWWLVGSNGSIWRKTCSPHPAKGLNIVALRSLGLKFAMEIWQGIFKNKFHTNNFHFYKQEGMSINRHEMEQLHIMAGYTAVGQTEKEVSCSRRHRQGNKVFLSVDSVSCLTPSGNWYYWTSSFRACIFFFSFLSADKNMGVFCETKVFQDCVTTVPLQYPEELWNMMLCPFSNQNKESRLWDMKCNWDDFGSHTVSDRKGAGVAGSNSAISMDYILSCVVWWWSKTFDCRL
jgi:hypothetical protein